jgi:predicted DNA-binding WGR domain protein
MLTALSNRVGRPFVVCIFVVPQEEKAENEMQKIIRSKEKKGYERVDKPISM